MPQMSPLMWLILYFYMLMMMMLVMIILFSIFFTFKKSLKIKDLILKGYKFMW